MTKICSKCKKEKPLSSKYYNKRKSSKDGYNGVCKECKKEYNQRYWVENKKPLSKKKKQYYEENKEDALRSMRAYRENNKDYFDEYNNKYYEENRDAILEQKREHYQENKEEKLAYREKHYEENRERLIEYSRQYYKENRERIAEYNKEYRQNNKELRNVLEQRRKAKKKDLPNNYTTQDWEDAKAYFYNSCAYCGSKKELTQDHFLPLSKGGEYTINNIVPVCINCNCSKRDKNFFEWYPQQSFYSENRYEGVLKYLSYIDKHIQQLSIL